MKGLPAQRHRHVAFAAMGTNPVPFDFHILSQTRRGDFVRFWNRMGVRILCPTNGVAEAGGFVGCTWRHKRKLMMDSPMEGAAQKLTHGSPNVGEHERWACGRSYNTAAFCRHPHIPSAVK